MYHPAVVAKVTMLYIISLVLIYHTTWNLYILTTFLQFPVPLTSTSSNHKSDLFYLYKIGMHTHTDKQILKLIDSENHVDGLSNFN